MEINKLYMAEQKEQMEQVKVPCARQNAKLDKVAVFNVLLSEFFPLLQRFTHFTCSICSAPQNYLKSLDDSAEQVGFFHLFRPVPSVPNSTFC
jgi:hypothetical protein